MPESQAAVQGSRHAAGKAPPPRIPPLAQRGDEGAERRERLLGPSPQTLARGDDIITVSGGEGRGRRVPAYVFCSGGRRQAPCLASDWP